MVSSSPESSSPAGAAPSGHPGDGETGRGGADEASNAAALYERISSDEALTQALFRQALQDPGGALDRIVALGSSFGLPVSREAVKAHVASLDDAASKQWLLKARGGL